AAGFVLAVVLFLHGDTHAIVALLATAGIGLLATALVHVLPMVLNARAWQALFPGSAKALRRPTLTAMTWAVWVREAVNGLLPVARVGGEIASYRLLRLQGARASAIVASLIVDMALSMLSQLVFALIGMGLLVAAGGPSGLMRSLLLGVLIMVPLAGAF